MPNLNRSNLIPDNLEDFFSEMPLVGKESRDEYIAFWQEMVADIGPESLVETLYLKDFVALTWEIRRDRRIKVAIIQEAQRKYLMSPATRQYCDADFDEDIMYGVAIAARERMDKKLIKAEENSLPALANAYMRGCDDIDAVEERIANAERRRNQMLREMSWVRKKFGRKAEKAARDADGEKYAEAAE